MLARGYGEIPVLGRPDRKQILSLTQKQILFAKLLQVERAK
jgi:hypothetical protein